MWSGGRYTGLALFAIIAFVIPVVSAHLSEAEEDQSASGLRASALPCNLMPSETYTVVSVLDASTLVLDDGRLLRLAGLLPPVAPRSLNPNEVWAPEKASVDALNTLVVGRMVTVGFVLPKRDRYGAIQGHAFVHGRKGYEELTTGGDAVRAPLVWVQAEILLGGHARAYEPAGQSDCFELLVSYERRAQASGLGLWGHGAYRALPAAQTGNLLKRRGTYVRVFGTIQSVTRRSKYTYLNFGENWRTDFTIAVPGRFRRDHGKWAEDLSSLESRTVEVSGWLVSRNGPNVELEHPAQLHVLGKGARAGPALEE